ncbi:MAG: hypothetical protein L0338_26170 [Acidobacteria bacterium]|nr:hypothetical protein [Acidobacteriota bacterium]
MSSTQFPQSVIERIGFYVYTLADPTTGKVFYVGKGTGNRVFSHAEAAIAEPLESDKLSKISHIQANGHSVRHEIIRHGMTEQEAFEVESALIDYIGLDGLSNRVAGHDMDTRGRMSAAEIIALYESPSVYITEPVLLIIVNRLFRRNMTPQELYEVTRGNWVLGERRRKARYALSVYRGIVREVYRISGWAPSKARSPEQKRQSRWRFEGEVARELRHYVGGSVEHYLTPGAQSPTKYINC